MNARIVTQILMFGLVGCLERPYEPYFEDAADGPVLTGVTFTEGGGFLGGGTAEIQGGRLHTTRTVVVGGRNAKILETDFERVVIELPSHGQTGEALDLVVVTDFGFARMSDAIAYRSHLGDYAADEKVSVAIGRLECPIEGYGYTGDALEPILWCGGEFGYADAIAFSGNGIHPGYATDILEIAPLGGAPPVGDVRFFGPNDRRPPSPPLILGPHALGDAVTLTTARDFDRDVRLIEDRLALVQQYYYWSFAIDPDSVRQVAAFFDADGVQVGQSRITGADGDTLTLAQAPPPETTGVWTGYRFAEVYDGDPELYETEAWVGTASVTPSGSSVVGAGAGAWLEYDDFSGFFFPVGVAGLFGQSEVVRRPYEIATVRAGVTTVHGTVEGPRPVLDLLDPDLLSGREVLRTDSTVEIHWIPDQATDDPSIVVAELKIYDQDVRDPNYQTELFRVVATATDADGRVRFPASVLAQLPARVENRFDANYDFTGLWGDITVARHQLRKVRLADDSGDVVVDFIQAVNAPVGLLR
ncbi:MAG: hypothetical protein H6737_16485 [Alphaproteobacteria bacterium]|nr:hypothetical protein [Alphaproteobacteria bacterium]